VAEREGSPFPLGNEDGREKNGGIYSANASETEKKKTQYRVREHCGIPSQ